MRVIVMTSDNYLWALRPFCYLFNIYWSSLQPVLVVGYAKPDFPLPSNFEFMSVGPQTGPEQWSGTLIAALNHISDSHFVLMLEDYWLQRTVDHVGIQGLTNYCQMHSEVIRLDLTDDRLHARGDARDARDYEPWGHYDLIITTNDFQYQFSIQAGIWNKQHMLNLLQPGKSPWEVELYTKVPDGLVVLGTRQFPLRYANALLKGKFIEKQWARIPEEHRKLIIDSGWLKEAIYETGITG